MCVVVYNPIVVKMMDQTQKSSMIVVLDARLLKKLDILVLSGKRYLTCEMTSGDGVQLRQADRKSVV